MRIVYLLFLCLVCWLNQQAKACPPPDVPSRPLSPEEKQQPTSTVHWSLTNAESNALAVPAGQTIKLVFWSNPSTGYSWSTVAAQNQQDLEFRECHYIRRPQSEEEKGQLMVGSGGHEEWFYTVRNTTKPGTVIMSEFIYKRPWIPDSEEEESQVAVVKILVGSF